MVGHGEPSSTSEGQRFQNVSESITSDHPEAVEQQAPTNIRSPDRFRVPFEARLGAAFATSFGVGAFLGAAQGARTSALRFRAENSHRFPTSQRGWYLYHRAKNAYVGSASLREATRMGMRIAPWVTLFVAIEEAVDEARWEDSPDLALDGKDPGGRYRDFFSTTIAGLSTAGLFGRWNRLPMEAWAGMIRMGLLSGMTFGLVQDALYLWQGHRLAYVDALWRFFGRRSGSGLTDEA